MLTSRHRLPLEDQLREMRTWTLQELMGLAELSPHGRILVEIALRTAWEDCLRTITPEPSAMRSAMRRTGTVLSGSCALAFLDRGSTWAPTDFDFYCPAHTFEDFCTFIVAELGGTVTTHTATPVSTGRLTNSYDGANAAHDDAAHDSYLHRSTTTTIIERRVICVGSAVLDVLRSAAPTALLPIPAFHSTIVVNFVSADGFVVAYPWSLSKKSSILAARPLTRSDLTAVQKYRGRGYTFFDHAREFCPEGSTAECASHGYCPHVVRHFGDTHCLAFTWEKQGRCGILHLLFSGMPVAACWVWGGRGCGNSTCNSDTAPIVSTILARVPITHFPSRQEFTYEDVIYVSAPAAW